MKFVLVKTQYFFRFPGGNTECVWHQSTDWFSQTLTWHHPPHDFHVVIQFVPCVWSYLNGLT